MNKYLQRLIASIVDDGPLLSLVAALLEVKVFLEDGREAVPLEQADALDQLGPVVRHALEVHQQADVVAVLGRDQQRPVHPLEQLVRPVLLQVFVEFKRYTNLKDVTTFMFMCIKKY